MSLRLTEAVVRRELGSKVYDRGLDVWIEGGVRAAEVSPDGARISGSVMGTQPQPYSQKIVLTAEGQRLRIRGACTCPVNFNCKHIAAVLIELFEAEAAATPPVPAVIRRDNSGIGVPAVPGMSATSAALGSLSPGVTSWLSRLAAAAAPASAPSPKPAAPTTKALLYVLDHADTLPGADADKVRVRPVTVRVRKDGTCADERRYDPDNVGRPTQIGAFVTEMDIAVLRDLVWLRRANYTGSLDIVLSSDSLGRRAFDAMLATGRLSYGSINGPRLAAGAPVSAAAQWQREAGGAQRLTLVPLEPAAIRFDAVLPLVPPLYVDRSCGLVGPIETALPPHLVRVLIRAPAVSLAEAAQVREIMRHRLQPKAIAHDAPASSTPASSTPATKPDTSLLPLPEAPDNVELAVVKPVPRLELMLIDSRLKSAYAWYSSERSHREGFKLPIARLSFAYGDEVVPIHAKVDNLQRIEGDRLILTPRDHAGELAAAERLHKLGLKSLAEMPFHVDAAHAKDMFLAPPGKLDIYDLIATFDDAQRFIEFGATAVPGLVEAGWHIVYADDYPFRLAEGEAEWWADTGEGSGIDWFSFELGIEFDGSRINLVPQLAALLSHMPADVIELAHSGQDRTAFLDACRDLQLYHTLPDGRLLPLPGERLAPILRSLIELIGPRGERIEDGRVKLHRAEAAALAQFAGDLDLAWAASAERLIALGRDLRRGRSLVPVVPPASFKASLRPYQADGLAWLGFLREQGFGGVLADDMGLGKTIQALAFLAREKAEGRLDKPALIIAPTSVLPNWQAEAERFAPTLTVLPLRGQERQSLFGAIASHDVVLTTYPLLARDHDVLLAQEFHAAILDEAQAIKNPKATVSKLAHRINARHRFALTGTPLENNLGEVWSLFEYLSPGLLGDETTFRRTFRTPIEKHGDTQAQAFLSRRLKPFMLRRTKTEVAPELPPKTEMTCTVRLEGPQRDLYETVRSLMHARVRQEIAKKGIAKSHIVFLDALLKLRQICCDPRLLKMPQARKVKGSAKLERLMEMVPELVGEGRRILLFSQFTSMLELIEAELDALSIPYVKLTGQTEDRKTPVAEFQSGKVPVFLLSLKAGGTGLNLTAADTVIHYDPWWNPAVEAQATDRAYRIGQDKPVFVYRMMVEEGIEEAIELLKARKAALAEALFAGSSKTPLQLSEADISALFAPLDRRSQRKAA